MYGLEVDSWTAVEPVPCLCAVSLTSSCKDFFEPKRMSRGTPKLPSLGVQKAFAHVNKVLILPLDDNEIIGECCTFNAHVTGSVSTREIR